MTAPTGMVDLFPAFSLGGVALIGLMARIEPPAAVRWSTVSALALVLAFIWRADCIRGCRSAPAYRFMPDSLRSLR